MEGGSSRWRHLGVVADLLLRLPIYFDDRVTLMRTNEQDANRRLWAAVNADFEQAGK
jgi:hypothetical protein